MNLFDVAAGRGTALALALMVGVAWLAVPGESPEPARIVVTDSSTTVLDVVEFAPGTATLRPTSLPTLDAVAETLRGNPSMELVEIQSHMRDVGTDEADLVLSQERADVVMAYLVAAGISPSRLEAQGYGDTQPIDRVDPARNDALRIAHVLHMWVVSRA
jgi:outer membrane protein OmpA-like peptidoglycan-associated protein